MRSQAKVILQLSRYTSRIIKNKAFLLPLFIVILFSCETTPSNEEYALIKYHKANGFFEKGMYKECIDLYEFVIRHRPLIEDAYIKLSACYVKLENLDKAVETLESFLRWVDPARKQVLWDLARFYEEAGKKNEAISTLGKLLEISPGDSRIKVEIKRLQEKRK